MELGPLTRFVPAAAFVVLGFWVWLTAPRRRLQQAFLALMLVHALFIASQGLLMLGFPATWFERVLWSSCLTIPGATVVFALTFHRAWRHPADRETPLPWRFAFWLAIVATVLLVAAYNLWAHAAWDESHMEYAAEAVVPLSGGLAALYLARAYNHADDPEDRSALYLFTLAFSAFPAYGGTFYLVEGIHILAGTDEAWLGQGALLWVVLGGSTIAASAFSVAFILHRATVGGRGGDIVGARWLAAVNGVAVATGAVPLALTSLPGDLDRTMALAFGAIWRMAFAAVVAYTLLRHCRFGLDGRFRVLAREGTFMLAVSLIFFIIGEALQDELVQRLGVAEILGLLGSLAIAALLTLAFWPLRAFLERWSRRAVPAPEDRERYERRAAAIYRAAYVAANQDGLVTEAERSALRRLATSLGLPVQAVRRVEREASSSPKPGARAGTATRPG